VTQMPVVYVVSDSVGETAEFVVRAAASQFDGGHCDLRRVSHVNQPSMIDETIQAAHEDGAIVAFTIVIPALKNHLLQAAKQFNVEVVDIMGPMVEAFAKTMGVAPRQEAGLVHQLNEDYFRRVDAVEFAVKYDDGRDVRGLERADIVLIGVSRTSKTPLSMYLAHRGFRVANVPLVPEVKPPEELFRLADRSKMIGLRINAEKLNAIRQERLKSLGLTSSANYANRERILTELSFAETVMKKLDCHVIDVSNKAVEETAGLIVEYITRRRPST
jgi:[pyruvate, water dikinase]-phosphate phosphotransferase / [pyruvate, water dikinase] kinase